MLADMTFTEREMAYLHEQPLGRVATVGPDGAPQVNPVAFWLDATNHRIEFSGPFLKNSQKFRNLSADPRISFVVDDIAAEPVGPGGQTGRGLEIRGHAELLTLERAPRKGFSADLIRIHPRRVIAWNIDGPGRNARTVSVPGSANVTRRQDRAGSL
jgi:pyridoxamine 5'-phosphate oxidase family protein